MTKYEAEVFENKNKKNGKRIRADMIPFGLFADQHFERIWTHHKNPNHVRNILKRLYNFIPYGTPVAAIDHMVVDDAITAMMVAGASGGTINRRLAVLSKLLKRAHFRGIIKSLPRIERQQENPGRERILSRDEEVIAMRFFEQTADPSFRCLFIFLLYTGCRVGEALAVRRSDVTDMAVTFRRTKNKDSRTIPLVPSAQESWREILQLTEAEYPFSATVGLSGIRVQWFRLRRHMDMLNDPEFVPHMLRHTCATRLSQKNVGLHRIMKWMGHRSIQVTLRYAKLSAGDLESAAIALAEEGEHRVEGQHPVPPNPGSA